jgi:hypothetical protein
MQEMKKQWLGRDGEEEHTATRARGQTKARTFTICSTTLTHRMEGIHRWDANAGCPID